MLLATLLCCCPARASAASPLPSPPGGDGLTGLVDHMESEMLLGESIQPDRVRLKFSSVVPFEYFTSVFDLKTGGRVDKVHNEVPAKRGRGPPTAREVRRELSYKLEAAGLEVKD